MKIEQCVLALACAASCIAAPAHGQSATDYPNRVVQIVVAQSSGDLVDTLARAVGQHFQDRLGQPFIVQSKPGGNQVIAAQAVAKSAPDGHTLYLATQGAMVFNSILQKSLPYSPQRDFVPISMIAESIFYLVVNPAVQARTVSELTALARSQPGKLTFASIGTGGAHHLLGELFKGRTKVDILHVPYKSSGAASVDLVAGRIDMMFQGGSGTLANIRGGKLRPVAALIATRSDQMPDVPTMAEAGMPDFALSPWFALFGPAGVPRPIVDRLNREAGELLRAPEARKKLSQLGVNLIPGTPEGLAERMRKDLPLWAKVAQDARIEPE